MAVQPRRVSKSRKKLRNSHSALKIPLLCVCSNCLKHVKSHSVCSCGGYKGKRVVGKK